MQTCLQETIFTFWSTLSRSHRSTKKEVVSCLNRLRDWNQAAVFITRCIWKYSLFYLSLLVRCNDGNYVMHYFFWFFNVIILCSSGRWLKINRQCLLDWTNYYSIKKLSKAFLFRTELSSSLFESCHSDEIWLQCEVVWDNQSEQLSSSADDCIYKRIVLLIQN